MKLINAEKLDKRLEHMAARYANSGDRVSAGLVNMIRMFVEEAEDENPMRWIPTEERTPTEQEADADHTVIAWHELNGTMMCDLRKVVVGSFYKAWIPDPGKPF